MKLLCMPSDFRTETIEGFSKLNSESPDIKTYETYGNLNPSPIQSGRAIDSPRLPKVTEEELRDYIALSKKQGIQFNYTLNASCTCGSEFTSRGLKIFLGTIERLINLGVRYFTLTSPVHISLVRSHWPDLTICTSVICEIDSVAAVRMFEDLGANRIIISEDVHRCFDVIHAMRKATELPLEVLTNSTCLFRCPWKAFHYNLLSHMSTTQQSDIEAYYHWRCMETRLAEPDELLRLRWIRPEDIDLYEDATYFKIVGRYFATDSDLLRVAQAYMDRSYEGNLWDLLGNFAPQRRHGIFIDNAALDGFLPWFKESSHNCRDMSCRSCDHCKKYAKRAVSETNLLTARKKLDVDGLRSRIDLFHRTGKPIQAITDQEIVWNTQGW